MAEHDVIKVWRGDDGWRWTKWSSGNNRRVGTSGEAFASRGNAIRAAWAEAEGTDATVEVQDSEPDAAA